MFGWLRNEWSRKCTSGKQYRRWPVVGIIAALMSMFVVILFEEVSHRFLYDRRWACWYLPAWGIGFMNGFSCSLVNGLFSYSIHILIHRPNPKMTLDREMTVAIPAFFHFFTTPLRKFQRVKIFSERVWSNQWGFWGISARKIAVKWDWTRNSGWIRACWEFMLDLTLQFIVGYILTSAKSVHYSLLQ